VIQWGAVRLLRCTNVVAALMFAAALWVQHVGLTMLAFALIGLAWQPVAPLRFRSGRAPRPTWCRTRYRGNGTVGYSGFLVGPPLLGWLAQASSLRAALSVLAILALVITALAHHVREPVRQALPP